MAKKMEARIIVREERGGKRRVSLVDPHTQREIQTGLNPRSADVERQVEQVKAQLEKAGNHATVHEV